MKKETVMTIISVLFLAGALVILNMSTGIDEEMSELLVNQGKLEQMNVTMSTLKAWTLSLCFHKEVAGDSLATEAIIADSRMFINNMTDMVMKEVRGMTGEGEAVKEKNQL